MELFDAGCVDVDAVLRVALDGAHLALSERSMGRIVASHELAAQVVASRPIYGRSTGVGANRTVTVQDVEGQLARLVRSHASGTGPWRSRSRVRAMCATRVAQFAADGNGVSLKAVEALIDAINRDDLPQVRSGGGIGTGDLTPLAAVGAWLLDRPEGPALEPGDGMVFISTNAATLADAMLGLRSLEALADDALEVASLVLAAANANLEAFSEAACAASPFFGVRRVCERVRMTVGDLEPARLQDPYALRCLPQVHGAALDALAHLRDVIRLMLNAPSENPVLSAEFGVAHHGGFHAIHLAQACERAASAIASSAAQSLARTALLADPTITGLHPFLADGTAGASGSMAVEYAAASRLSRIRALAAPVSLQSVTLSRGIEEGGSFASVAAVHLMEISQLWRELLGCELFTAVRCLTLQGRPVTGRFASLAGQLGDLADRDLTPDLDAATALLGEVDL